MSFCSRFECRPTAAVSVNGQSWMLRCGTMTSLPVSFWVYWMRTGQTFVLCPRILPLTSFVESTLYFPAHWPGYYYKWEGNNSWLQLQSAAHLPVHDSLWATEPDQPQSRRSRLKMMLVFSSAVILCSIGLPTSWGWLFPCPAGRIKS